MERSRSLILLILSSAFSRSTALSVAESLRIVSTLVSELGSTERGDTGAAGEGDGDTPLASGLGLKLVTP